MGKSIMIGLVKNGEFKFDMSVSDSEIIKLLSNQFDMNNYDYNIEEVIDEVGVLGDSFRIPFKNIKFNLKSELMNLENLKEVVIEQLNFIDNELSRKTNEALKRFESIQELDEDIEYSSLEICRYIFPYEINYSYLTKDFDKRGVLKAYIFYNDSNKTESEGMQNIFRYIETLIKNASQSILKGSVKVWLE